MPYLGDDIEVGDQGTLQNDGDVGGVEQLDGVGGVLAPITSTLDRQVHTEPLQHAHTYTYPDLTDLT